MTRRALISLVVLWSLLAVPARGQQSCGRFENPVGAIVVETRSGYQVRRTSVRPSHITEVFRSVEALAAFDTQPVFFLTNTNEVPFSDELIASGATRAECLESFLHAAGLGLGRSREGGAVVGTPQQLDEIGVVVFTYPLLDGSESQGELPRDELDRLLFELPGARYWGLGLAANWIGIGFAPIEEEDADVYLVVMTIRTEENLQRSEKILKTRLDRASMRLACDWSIDHPVAFPALEFAEDLDGDGIRDFLLDGSFTSLLDGGSGRVMARFIADNVAVGETTDGSTVIAVKGIPRGEEGFDSGILVLDTESRIFVRESAGTAGRQQLRPDPATLVGAAIDEAAVLTSAGIPTDRVRVYTLPERARRWFGPDIRMTRCSLSRQWSRLITSDTSLATAIRSTPGVSMVMSYLPERFLAYYEEIWGPFPLE